MITTSFVKAYLCERVKRKTWSAGFPSLGVLYRLNAPSSRILHLRGTPRANLHASISSERRTATPQTLHKMILNYPLDSLPFCITLNFSRSNYRAIGVYLTSKIRVFKLHPPSRTAMFHANVRHRISLTLGFKLSNPLEWLSFRRIQAAAVSASRLDLGFLSLNI